MSVSPLEAHIETLFWRKCIRLTPKKIPKPHPFFKGGLQTG